jgi:hypothetical protein
MPSPTTSGVLVPRTATANGPPLDSYGRDLLGGYLDDRSSGSTLIRPKWDTMRSVSPDPVLNITPSNLRSCMYAVVPGPPGSCGRLVRAVRAQIGVPGQPAGGSGNTIGNWISRDQATGIGMVIDAVLSDHVARIVFSTRRHDASLQLNQVRVRVWLAAPFGTGDTDWSTSVVTIDLVLGTRNGPTDAQQDLEALGEAVPFLR